MKAKIKTKIKIKTKTEIKALQNSNKICLKDRKINKCKKKVKNQSLN